MTVEEKLSFHRQQLLEMGYLHPLESDLQMCEFLAEYELGVQLFLTLSDPTAVDERWAGLCYMACGHRERAAELFMRSIERGCYHAKIDLSRLFIVLGRYDDAVLEIESLEPEKLIGYNKALWHRNYSFLHQNKGEGKLALRHMNMAWRYIQNCPEFKFLAPKILSGLANIYANQGNNKRALYYTIRAEEISLGDFVWTLRFYRMFIYMDMGRISDAEEVAEDLMYQSGIELYVIIAGMVKGQAALIYGNLEKARCYFQDSNNKASEAMLGDLELISSGYLSIIYFCLSDIHRSNFHLVKMNEIKSSPPNENLYLLRKICIDRNIDNYAKNREIFINILQFRERQEDITEIIRVLIGFVDFLIYFNDREVEIYADKLIDIIIKRNAQYNSLEEWTFFPLALSYIQEHYNNILPVFRKNILIKSIHQEYIEFDHKPIKLPLKKTLEVVVYLIYHKHSTLPLILTDVFPDVEIDKAKNYFHQIRYMLNQQQLPIRIDYDKASRRYYLHSEFNIVWDLQDVLDGKAKLEGIFLPSSGSDWVIELNQRLSE